MEKQKQKGKLTKRSNQGITLIALVITIIVLLILAGVAIATLTGDNGLLRKGTTSSQRNRTSKKKRRNAIITA